MGLKLGFFNMISSGKFTTMDHDEVLSNRILCILAYSKTAGNKWNVPGSKKLLGGLLSVMAIWEKLRLRRFSAWLNAALESKKKWFHEISP